MTSDIKIAAVSINTTPMAFSENRRIITSALEELRLQDVKIVCFPELCLSGYGCEDFFFNEDTAVLALKSLAQIIPLTTDITAIVGLPIYHNGHLYNAAAVIQNKRLLGLVPKKVLARSGVHYEPRWFTPWPRGYVTETNIMRKKVKIGDLLFTLGSVNIGIEICEEAWSPSPPSTLFSGSIDILFNPSASHFEIGKYALREHLVANASRSQACLYVYTNLMGLEAGRLIYDGGNLFAFEGKIIERGERFSFKSSQHCVLPFNMDIIRSKKLSTRSYEEPVTLTSYSENCVVFGDELDTALSTSHNASVSKLNSSQAAAAKPLACPRNKKRKPQSTTATPTSISQKVLVPFSGASEYTDFEFEEFLRAEALALFDYLRKTKAHGYVVPLSGGADSTTALLLIADMFSLACQEMGLKKFCQTLWPVHYASKKTISAQKVLGDLVAALYMATPQNSKKTLESARSLCNALGLVLLEGDIGPIVKDYEKLFKEMTHIHLSWEKHDIVKQNLQARVRAPLAWILANVRKAILITTSNRSEASVGYATMDGDMAGGLAPLGGISKVFIKQFLGWHAARCTVACGKVRALEKVLTLAPSAELRPINQGQEDEKDLMPYDVLRCIEVSFLSKKLSVEEIQDLAYRQFPEFSKSQINLWISRFIRLWQRSQWKRERIAPTFHLEAMSQDPKYASRYPIFCQDLTEES